MFLFLCLCPGAAAQKLNFPPLCAAVTVTVTRYSVELLRFCICQCTAKVCGESLKLWPFVVFAQQFAGTRLFVASLAQTTTTLAKCRRKPIISFATTTGVAPPRPHSPLTYYLAYLSLSPSLGGCLTKKKQQEEGGQREILIYLWMALALCHLQRPSSLSLAVSVTQFCY